MLKEILLPAFFEQYPGGEVRLVRYNESINSPLAILSILQRAKILRTGNPDVLERYAGTSPLSSLSLHVPAEALFYMLSFGMVWTYPTIYGFVGTCQHRHFLVFILDHPFDVNIEDATAFARMTPGLGNVMNTRVEPIFRVSKSYVPPERRYPLNRRRFAHPDVVSYLDTYVAAVGLTFAWLNDFNNFGAAKEPDVFDVDFAYATWLSTFVLLVTQFGILESQRHFSRKLSFFDSLELLAALMTSNSKAQTQAWLDIASDEFARNTLRGHVGRYGGGFGVELEKAVQEIRNDAAAIVDQGLIYPRQTDGRIVIPNQAAMSFGEFEPALYRALRNTRHGFAIRGSDLLSIHSGEIHNDLPDLSIALFLGFLMDKTPYPLNRT